MRRRYRVNCKEGLEVIRFFGKVIVVGFRIQPKPHDHEKNMRSDGYVSRGEGFRRAW
jgi:hypothetical protein